MAPILRLSARSTSAHHQHTAREAQQRTRLADDGRLTIQLPRALSYPGRTMRSWRTQTRPAPRGRTATAALTVAAPVVSAVSYSSSTPPRPTSLASAARSAPGSTAPSRRCHPQPVPVVRALSMGRELADARTRIPRPARDPPRAGRLPCLTDERSLSLSRVLPRRPEEPNPATPRDARRGILHLWKGQPGQGPPAPSALRCGPTPQRSPRTGRTRNRKGTKPRPNGPCGQRSTRQHRRTPPTATPPQAASNRS